MTFPSTMTENGEMELNYLTQEEREQLALAVPDSEAAAELLDWANHARYQTACVNLILKGEATVQVDPDIGVTVRRVNPPSTRRSPFRSGIDGVDPVRFA